jgi:hypothetical protein
MHHDSTERVEAWLLNGSGQWRGGPHHGAIAGWLGRNNRPEVLYPEIAGYFLTWVRFLDELASARQAVADEKARQAAKWLLVRFETESTLPTRYWLQPTGADWRNNALFSFDLAMIYRGLRCVENLLDEQLRHQLLGYLIPHLLRFCPLNGTLVPCLPRDQYSVPQRWSTQPGPHQLKTAAALLFSSNDVPSEIESAAINTYERWVSSAAGEDGIDNPHAMLYAIEGLILFGIHGREEAWELASNRYQQLLRRLRSSRCDVVAQALRAGCILHSRDLLTDQFCNRVLPNLANALLAFMGPDGELFYTRTKSHRNVWGALFAHQALLFYHKWRGRNGLPAVWSRFLI